MFNVFPVSVTIRLTAQVIRFKYSYFFLHIFSFQVPSSLNFVPQNQMLNWTSSSSLILCFFFFPFFVYKDDGIQMCSLFIIFSSLFFYFEFFLHSFRQHFIAWIVLMRITFPFHVLCCAYKQVAFSVTGWNIQRLKMKKEKRKKTTSKTLQRYIGIVFDMNFLYICI